MVSQLPSQDVMRSMRFWLVTTKPPATTANVAAARRKKRAGTPDTKSRAATIPMRTNAVPRSWPTRTSPTVTTTMGTRKGTTTCLRLPSSLRFRDRTAAPTRMSPSLTSSEGWICTPGSSRTQLRLPLTRDAERREDQRLQHQRRRERGHSEPAVPPHGDVRGDGRSDDADGSELRLVQEDAERRAVVPVGRDHRGGQHHDEADDDEDHRGAEQDVVGGDRRLQAREERQRPVEQAVTPAGRTGRGRGRASRRTGRRARHRRRPSAQRRTATSKASPRAP